MKISFKELNGYRNKVENCCSFKKMIPYELLNFNNLLDTINDTLEIDGRFILIRHKIFS